MQIRLDLTSKKDIILPIHYNAIIQGFIYNNMDKDLASFLHDRGYVVGSRSFKLFTFSRILKKGRKQGKFFNFGRNISFIVASPLEEFCRNISKYMLIKDDLRLGRNKVSISNINLSSYRVEGDEIKIQTLSPIVSYTTIYKEDGSKYTYYFKTDEEDFNRIVTENLVRKYKAFHGVSLEDYQPLEFTAQARNRQNLTYFKNVIIKGSSGEYLVKGDRRLLQLAMDCGFGSKNSQGFGLVKLI